jgi:hypothetical protein
MAEPEDIQLGDMEDMPSVVGAAFERSGIHYEVKDFVNPLGMEPVDWFMLNICAGAGISVELLNEAPNEDRYTMVQIVDPDEMNEQLKKKDPEVIAYSPEADMHGVVIKLGMNHKWKVTVTEENLEQHITSVRGARRGGAAVKSTTFENWNSYEIAVPVPDEGMRCCAATMRTMTIIIAFKLESEKEVPDSLWNDKNHLPFIYQRRIDGVFTNSFVTAVQVRVLECS